MVGWHHRLNGHGFGWTPAVGDGQGGLACCGSWGCKESDMTERLNRTEHCARCLFRGTSGVLNQENVALRPLTGTAKIRLTYALRGFALTGITGARALVLTEAFPAHC